MQSALHDSASVLALTAPTMYPRLIDHHHHHHLLLSAVCCYLLCVCRVKRDHNQWGSWDGWAGGSITALAELGDYTGALDFTRALSGNLDEGPFGQANRVFGAGEGEDGVMARPARKDQSW